MNQAISEPGTSQASGLTRIQRQSIGPKESYTPGEKRRALSRHTVTSRDTSTRNLVVMGAIGTLAGGALAGVAGSGADFSWMRVAATGALSAALSVLGTVVSARQKTPLENARAELRQTEEDRLCLISKDVDNPAHEFDANEIYTIKRLSERYPISLPTLKPLWDVLYSPDHQGDFDHFFLCEIFSRFSDRDVSCREIVDVHEQMADTKSLAEAMLLKTFKDLIRDHFIGPTTRNELAELMFTYTRLTPDANNGPGGATPHSLYQSLCREAYLRFRLSIDHAQARALNDVDVLLAMANEQR